MKQLLVQPLLTTSIVIFLRDGNGARSIEFHDATLKNLEVGFATIKTCREFITSLSLRLINDEKITK